MTTTDKMINGWQIAIAELQTAITWAREHRTALDAGECSSLLSGGGSPWALLFPSVPDVKAYAKSISPDWLDQGGNWRVAGVPFQIDLRHGLPEMPETRKVEL